MTLKEKLDLLWKYLLLAVLVFGIAKIGSNHRAMMASHCLPGGHGDKMLWFGDEDCNFGDVTMDVEVEKLMDRDSTITVIVNGETIELDDLDKLEDNVFIKKMKHHDGGMEHKIKVIKKKKSDD